LNASGGTPTAVPGSAPCSSTAPTANQGNRDVPTAPGPQEPAASTPDSTSESQSPAQVPPAPTNTPGPEVVPTSYLHEDNDVAGDGAPTVESGTAPLPSAIDTLQVEESAQRVTALAASLTSSTSLEDQGQTIAGLKCVYIYITIRPFAFWCIFGFYMYARNFSFYNMLLASGICIKRRTSRIEVYMTYFRFSLMTWRFQVRSR